MLETFPGAEIVDVRVLGDALAAPPVPDDALPPVADEGNEADASDA